MDLKSMLLPEKVVSLDFPGYEGLTFDVTFLSKESNQAIIKKCQNKKFDSKTRRPVDSFDDDLYLKLYVENVVKGWKGFKLSYLKDMVLVEIPKDMADEELDYTQENALDLVKNSVTFDSWLADVAHDLSNFTKSSS